MLVSTAILVIFIAIAVWCLLVKNSSTQKDDFTTGFAVTSGLAMNNRTARCWEGDGYSLSPGCTIPHRVII